MKEVLQSLKGRHKAGEGAELAAIFFGGFSFQITTSRLKVQATDIAHDNGQL